MSVTSLLVDPNHYAAPTNVSLEAIVIDAWADTAHIARRDRIAFSTRAMDGIEVLAERRALRQALINLFCETLSLAAPDDEIVVRASIDGPRVLLEIALRSPAAAKAEAAQTSLYVCLAHALLCIQGAALQISSDDGRGWSATLLLDRATQADFFATQPAHVRSSHLPCDRTTDATRQCAH